MKILFLLYWLTGPLDSIPKPDSLFFYGANRAKISSNASAKMGNFAYTNALSYLNGAGTGIETFAPIGQPGSDPQVIIRSKGLLPQYMNIILDGLPFYGTMADIQVQDIESIEVLKDAVSTSMLGHYPLQGIIRIQTKRQATNTFALTINSGIAQKGAVEPDVLEPKAYYEYAWKVIRDLNVNWGIPLEHANLLASGLWPRDSDGIQKYNGINYGDVHSYLRNPKIFNIPNSELMDSEGKLNPSAQILNPENLNWWKEVARTGQRHEVHGSFHKRFRTLYFYTSASLLKEEGWAYNSFLERATGRLSLTYSPLSWLSMGVDASLSKAKEDKPLAEQGNANPFYFARTIGPIYPIYAQDSLTGEVLTHPDGTKIVNENYGSFNSGNTPANNFYEDKTRRKYFTTRAYLQFRIRPWLKWQSTFSLDKITNHNEQIRYWYQAFFYETFVENKRDFDQYQHRLFLHKATSSFTVNYNLGFEKSHYEAKYISTRYRNYANEERERSGLTWWYPEENRKTLFSNFDATFPNKLRVEGSIRKNYDTPKFTSFGVGAYYTQHFSAFKPIEVNLSWGENNQDPLDYSRLMTTLNVQKSLFSTGVKIGDFFRLTYYRGKDTEAKQTMLVGASQQFITYAKKGWEMTLQGTLVQNRKFRWQSSFHFTLQTTKLLKLPHSFSYDYIEGRYVEIGSPLENYQFISFQGIDPATGNPTYWLAPDGLTTDPNLATKTKKAFDPHAFGSWMHDVQFYKWSVTLMLNYQIGGYMKNQHLRSLDIFGKNIRSEVLEGTFPAIMYNDHPYSDRWLTRSDYLNLNKVRLSYSFTKHISLQLNGENLFFWTKEKGANPVNADADAYTYSLARRVNLGAQFSF